MRNPSLHITKTALETILNEMQYDSRTTGTKLANMIMEAAQPYQMRDRYKQLSLKNKKVRDRVEKVVASEELPVGVIEQINLLIVKVRNDFNPFVKARPVIATSKDYILMKEIAKMAYDFSNHFKINPRYEGYREFIEIGLKFMGKYGLNRFKTYESRIYETFENKVEVLNDDKENDTLDFYELWQNKMLEYVDELAVPKLKDNYSNYIHMLYGRRAADEADAYYEDWIVAQFEGLAFLNTIPELQQFYGENALKRYERYINSVDVDTKESSGESILDYYKNEKK